MIRLLKNHHIDYAKYDLCVAMDRSGLPYAQSWYLDTLCEWETLVKDDYDAVWPLPVNQKWGISYYYRPFGIQQLGIYSKKLLSEEDIEAFTRTLTASTRYADVYMNEGQLPGPLTGLRVASLPNYVLSLQKSYEQLYSGFNNNTRRNLKKSQRSKLEVFGNDSPSVLIQLFKQYKGKRLKLPEAFYRQMEKLMFALLHRNQGKLYTVYGGPNELLAGAFLAQTGKRHVLLFTGISDRGKESGAMYYLINEYLIFHSGQDALFDFEGSKDPGTARFFKGFGAEERSYSRLLYNRLPFYLSWLKQ